MDGHDQMAYDRGTSIFSPDGRLYQVEYAREAVKRGSSTVGVKTSAGVVLAVDKRVGSSLMEGESIEKLHVVDDHLAAASAGHVADGRRLVDELRRDAQINRLRYGEPIGVKTATRHVSDLVQAYTQVGGARPFGAALLVAGVDSDGTARLYETDPSGTVDGWQAVAVGADRGEIQAFLETEYDPELDLADATALALRAISVPDDERPDVDQVAVATVDVETRTVDVLDDDALASHLDALPPVDEDDGGDGSGSREGSDGDDAAGGGSGSSEGSDGDDAAGDPGAE
ncbi:archaeal proteasome endopeptidase complex subunit alpha [Halorubellus salinus]|uniref:archaeal proteasome endopeptidase complex subunit alpha n=1 Tax=Halorubellus salinus TaxID=755309 RepID=UPI001D06D921|nr:archaeal proteasome endopeptidase complex subunit alpha [Halorubellus salinus]